MNMNGITTRGFENIQENWRHFQNSKLQEKMANAFPCNFRHSRCSMFACTLSFITEGDHRMEFQQEFGSFTILLADIQGYNLEATHFVLVLRPPLGSVIVEFQSQAVYALAATQLESFTREIGKFPTPPPSSSSSSSEGD